MAWQTGDLIGEYRLLEPIGSGAAGHVYQAEHLLTRRIEAIKFLSFSDADAEQSFLREIELQARLQHPNIAAVHNACRTPEGLALVMELVDGEPLSAILARGRVPLPEAVRYARETLAGLAYAHSRGIVHGDVKPANIIIGPDGTAKLTDFGLARSLHDPAAAPSGSPAGSPYYMSPEQVTGVDPPDARSDCYSLGVVLYELVAGRRPFEGDSPFEVMIQHREASPAPPIKFAPAVGAELNRAILTALEKDPARRFQSAAEFRTALAPVRQGRLLRWLTAAAMSAMALGAVLLASHRPEVPPAPLQIVQPPPPAPVLTPTAPLPVVQPPPADPDPAPAIEPAPRRKPSPASPPVRRLDPPPPAAPPPEEIAVLPPAPAPGPQVLPASAPTPLARLANQAASSDSVPEPPKKRNVVWRALGHIVHPGRSHQ